MRRIRTRLCAALALALPSLALAHEKTSVIRQGPSMFVTGISVLANVAYAVMRAQDSKSHNIRAVAFLLGFPLTVLSLAAVTEGSERAYGVEAPRKPVAPPPTDE